MKKLGQIIRAARAERRLTLQAFAVAAGVSAGTVAAIEYGGRVRRETVEKLVRYLNLSPSDLELDGPHDAG